MSENDTAHNQSTALQARALWWQDFIGQTDMLRRLDVRIQAALAGGRSLPHLCLVGKPGMGKTTLASMVAARLGSAFKVSAQPMGTSEIVEVLLAHADEKLVLFWDEIHRWTPKQMDAVLSLLEEGVIDDASVRVEHRQLTVIAGTTRRDILYPALLDRFPQRPCFVPYSREDLAAIVAGMAERVGVALAPEKCLALGEAAAGTPRKARALVEAARDLTDLSGVEPEVSDVLDLAGVSKDGLDDDHLRYLQVLADSQKQKLGLDPLSARLGMRRSLVEGSIESLLFELGMVEQEQGGRALTDKGAARLKEGMAF